MKCFHGTTQENFVNLINGGDKPSGVWNCSDMDGCFYVYPVSKFYDVENLDDEQIIDEGIKNALDSASITAAYQMKSQKLVILELDIPEDDLQDDWSCENMSDVASFTEYFDKEWIKKVYTTEFNAMYAPFFVPNLNNRNLGYIPDELRNIAAIVQRSDEMSNVYCDIFDTMQFNVTETAINDLTA
ncbi:hypothetical protein FDI99_gp031 [Shigella phage Sf14]|uniref:Uncharacterized protein n=1 Tax=Shigella phage Sf14 TaxID=2024304 RepID=A0A2K9VKQ3_9CAUD|nr:hypothetical protein FDI99_gp031 [Shigella phage Sf14]AUV62867.1 hypothetical protein Sf14_gp126 [Shigella phage Sf14]